MGNQDTITIITPVSQPNQQGACNFTNNKISPDLQDVDLESQTQTNPQPIVAPIVAPIVFTQEDLRRGFVRKVLALLMFQLFISAIAIGLTFIEGTGIREFLMNTFLPLYITLGVSFFVILVLLFTKNIARKVPVNYILLFTFTVCMSYNLATLAAYTESDIVLLAGGFTCVIVLATTLYATFIKVDLTKWRCILFGAFIVSLLMLTFCLIFRGRFLSVLYSALICLLYIVILAFNIGRLTGRYEQKYSLDEYVIASLELYLDVVRIFVIILAFLGGCARN